MADDMLIGVGVKADFSSLKNEAKASADALKQAEVTWKAAFQELGQAAQQGSMQAQEALKQYEAELQQAQQRAASAAKAMAEAQASAGAAASHAVPQFAAASGALRELQGNFDHNIRAAERFLSTTLGLGPALQAAFPVVGALALAGVLFEVGKSLGKFASDADALSRELGIGWLDAAIGQLTGLAEAAKQADAEFLKLAQDRDQVKKESQQDDVEAAKLRDKINNTVTAPDIEKQQIQDRIKALRDLMAVQKQAISEAEGRAKDAESQHVELPGLSGAIAPVTTNAAADQDAAKARLDLKVATDQYNTSLRTMEELTQRLGIVSLQAQLDQQHVAKKDDAAQRKADEERMRADKVAFDQLRISHQLTIAEEQSFWQERLAKYSQYSSQYAEIVGKLAQLADQQRRADAKSLREGSKEATDEVITSKKHEEEENQKISDEIVRTWQQELKQEEENAIAATRSAEVQIEAAAKVAEARVEYQLASGMITAQAAAHELAAIKAKAYGDQIKALEEELRKLQSIEGTGGNTQGRQNEVQDKIFGLKGDQNAALIQGATKEALQYEKPWLKAFDTIGRQWMRVQDQILMGQTSLVQGAARMVMQLELDWLHGMENMLIQDFKFHEQSVLANQIANTEKTASNVAAATTGDALQRSSSLKQIFMEAKTAAAHTWSAVSAIPVIGPVLAPPAAAAAFAGVMALAAFAEGGIVGGPFGSAVPIVAHAGERVLSTSQTLNFETLVNNQSRGSSSSTVINARVNQNFNGSKASSARETRAAVQNLARRGKLALG